ncbi:MAG: bifunctional DNA-formamidopyrimidine glycosylase/DNA-(apurinic or apyrimidinic site) lyase [Alphaproteobacteria bacterium]
MPELPEVETVMRGLEPVLTSASFSTIIQRRPNLRYPIPDNFVERLKNQQVLNLQRRAKYILIRMSSGESMLIHLGMSGRVTISKDLGQDFEKHDHLIFETDNGHQIRYHDPRRFGFVDLFPTDEEGDHPRLKDLGPEPLSNAFSGPSLFASFVGKNTPVKTAIMEQKRVVGVGNIYACESLYKAGINPCSKAGNLNLTQAEDLVSSIKQTLQRAIEVGGSSLNDYVQASGELGYFQHEWQVYGRENEPCHTCKDPIMRITQAQRSTFYCKTCQSQ